MSYVVTKLVTSEKSLDFFLLGTFSDMKQAAAAAVEEYKEYNKAASFVNLQMVNEWLSTRGEYSFRQDAAHRLQLDISRTEENEPVPAEHRKIFSCSEQDKVWVQVSSALVPDGVSKAEL
ncbi:MAG: hypothetical protein PHQ44_05695 [Anaerovibrio sp.]|nr:hypothetical protein [Anaerovibrio sp.]